MIKLFLFCCITSVASFRLSLKSFSRNKQCNKHLTLGTLEEMLSTFDAVMDIDVTKTFEKSILKTMENCIMIGIIQGRKLLFRSPEELKMAKEKINLKAIRLHLEQNSATVRPSSMAKVSFLLSQLPLDLVEKNFLNLKNEVTRNSPNSKFFNEFIKQIDEVIEQYYTPQNSGLTYYGKGQIGTKIVLDMDELLQKKSYSHESLTSDTQDLAFYFKILKTVPLETLKNMKLFNINSKMTRKNIEKKLSKATQTVIRQIIHVLQMKRDPISYGIYVNFEEDSSFEENSECENFQIRHYESFLKSKNPLKYTTREAIELQKTLCDSKDILPLVGHDDSITLTQNLINELYLLVFSSFEADKRKSFQFKYLQLISIQEHLFNDLFYVRKIIIQELIRLSLEAIKLHQNFDFRVYCATNIAYFFKILNESDYPKDSMAEFRQILEFNDISKILGSEPWNKNNRDLLEVRSKVKFSGIENEIIFETQDLNLCTLFLTKRSFKNFNSHDSKAHS